MKRQQLKSFIESMVRKTVLREVHDEPAIQNMTPVQRQAVTTLIKMQFVIQRVYGLSNGIGVILLRKAGQGTPARAADIKPDGTINEPNVDLNKFLALISKDAPHVPVGIAFKQTEQQSKVVKDLERRGYNVKSSTPLGKDKVKIIMTKSAGRFGGEEAVIEPDGAVSGTESGTAKSSAGMGVPMIEDEMPVTKDRLLKRGLVSPMGFVNIGENIPEKYPSISCPICRSAGYKHKPKSEINYCDKGHAWKDDGTVLINMGHGETGVMYGP